MAPFLLAAILVVVLAQLIQHIWAGQKAAQSLDTHVTEALSQLITELRAQQEAPIDQHGTERQIAADAVAYAEQQRHKGGKTYGEKGLAVWTPAALEKAARDYAKTVVGEAWTDAYSDRMGLLIEAQLGHRGGRGPRAGAILPAPVLVPVPAAPAPAPVPKTK